MSFIEYVLTDYTLRTVALGAATLGLVSGALSVYAVLRGQSLVGDAISHAALPGIALAFLATGLKVPIVLMVGAALTGWLATLAVMAVERQSRVKYDGALALMLSVFFGFGLVLLTYIQKQPNAAQAGLDTFLFGQAAALVERDVITMAVLGGVALAGMMLFWKEFKLLAFDPEFGRSLGLPMRALDVGLTTLIVIAIVIGLQTVGVVLMSAMIIAPAAAARQWTQRLGVMTVLSMSFGAISGMSGALISSQVPNIPTGPMIVLCVSGIVVVSLFLAPRRGLVAQWVRQRRNSRRLRLEAVLLDLYALAHQHDQHDHPHEEAALEAMSTFEGRIRRSLEALAEQGLVEQAGPSRWALTRKGYERAQELLTDMLAGSATPDAEPAPTSTSRAPTTEAT